MSQKRKLSGNLHFVTIFPSLTPVCYQQSQTSIQLYFFQHLHLPPTKTISPSLSSKPSLIADSFLGGKLQHLKKSLTFFIRDNQNLSLQVNSASPTHYKAWLCTVCLSPLGKTLLQLGLLQKFSYLASLESQKRPSSTAVSSVRH